MIKIDAVVILQVIEIFKNKKQRRMTMIKNKAILNEIEDRNKQSFEVNYKEIYEYLSANIHEEFYPLKDGELGTYTYEAI